MTLTTDQVTAFLAWLNGTGAKYLDWLTTEGIALATKYGWTPMANAINALKSVVSIGITISPEVISFITWALNDAIEYAEGIIVKQIPTILTIAAAVPALAAPAAVA